MHCQIWFNIDMFKICFGLHRFQILVLTLIPFHATPYLASSNRRMPRGWAARRGSHLIILLPWDRFLGASIANGLFTRNCHRLTQEPNPLLLTRTQQLRSFSSSRKKRRRRLGFRVRRRRQGFFLAACPSDSSSTRRCCAEPSAIAPLQGEK
jgi:hypothetical protein